MFAFQTKKITPASTGPNKERGIIFPALPDTPIHIYVLKLGELLGGGKSISHAARLSHQRICIYLKSEELVEQFLVEHGGVSINDKWVEARRMVTKTEKLILNNVPPEVIDGDLIEILSQAVRVVSPIYHLSLGIKHEGYEHIQSWKRMLYVVKRDGVILPDSFMVEIDGNPYRIFIESNNEKCGICNRHGHNSRECSRSLPPRERRDELLPELTREDRVQEGVNPAPLPPPPPTPPPLPAPPMLNVTLLTTPQKVAMAEKQPSAPAQPIPPTMLDGPTLPSDLSTPQVLIPDSLSELVDGSSETQSDLLHTDTDDIYENAIAGPSTLDRQGKRKISEDEHHHSTAASPDRKRGAKINASDLDGFRQIEDFYAENPDFSSIPFSVLKSYLSGVKRMDPRKKAKQLLIDANELAETLSELHERKVVKERALGIRIQRLVNALQS